MVERGELKLDEPVRLLLPKEWTLPKRGEREITLLDLATHTSGLPENPPNLLRAFLNDKSIDLDPFARFDHKQLAECLAEVKLKDVEKPPVAYSNLGMGLLGEALVIKTGKSYDELIRTQITEPLKMKDTVVIPSEAQDKRTATGHGKKAKELPCWTFASMAGAGAIRSTATDMLTYLEAQSGRTATPLAAAMAATQDRRQYGVRRYERGIGLVHARLRWSSSLVAQWRHRTALPRSSPSVGNLRLVLSCSATPALRDLKMVKSSTS